MLTPWLLYSETEKAFLQYSRKHVLFKTIGRVFYYNDKRQQNTIFSELISIGTILKRQPTTVNKKENGKNIKKYKKKDGKDIKMKLSSIMNSLSDMYQSQFDVEGLTFNGNLILISQQEVAKFSTELLYCLA